MSKIPEAAAVPTLPPEVAAAALKYLENAAIRGSDAPEFMTVVSHLQRIATWKPEEPSPT